LAPIGYNLSKNDPILAFAFGEFASRDLILKTSSAASRQAKSDTAQLDTKAPTAEVVIADIKQIRKQIDFRTTATIPDRRS
jgi:hypothetical protein